jgi:hypothetical protein
MVKAGTRKNAIPECPPEWKLHLFRRVNAEVIALKGSSYRLTNTNTTIPSEKEDNNAE